MSIDLKESIKNLGFILKNVSNDNEVLQEFVNNISDIFKSDILLIDNNDNILYEKDTFFDSFTIVNQLSGKKTLEYQVIKQLETIEDIKINITLDNLYTAKFERDILKDIYAIFIPLYIYKEKVGNIIIYRKKEPFEDYIEPVLIYIASVLSIIIYNLKKLEISENKSKIQNIKSCISTLSYSELEAILCIFEEIENNEGLVIASKIADKAGITRSVIVNALRKFESARIIETRSLGMKGTYIKVLNDYLLQELKKFKN